jgi:hypothetical protein
MTAIEELIEGLERDLAQYEEEVMPVNDEYLRYVCESWGGRAAEAYKVIYRTKKAIIKYKSKQ